MFLSGRSRQQSDANLTSVEVYVSVSSTLKLQRCRNLCFWKFVSLHPICKIEAHLRPESFLAIREYASYYRLPLWRRVVGQYIELETLPYLNFRLHLNSPYGSQLLITTPRPATAPDPQEATSAVSARAASALPSTISCLSKAATPPGDSAQKTFGCRAPQMPRCRVVIAPSQ